MLRSWKTRITPRKIEELEEHLVDYVEELEDSDNGKIGYCVTS